MNSQIRQTRLWSPLFLGPVVAAFAIGFVWPFIQGIYLSFCEFKLIKDARLTGFGNYQYISGIYHFPSVEQHLFHVGVAAADLLLDIVEGKARADEPHLHIVPSELVNLEYIPQRESQ